MSMTKPLNPIPVTVITDASKLAPIDDDTAMLRLPANTGHGHADGVNCVACSAQLDVRAQLHNLLEAAKLGYLPPFSKVVIDASLVADKGKVVDALTGKLPAQALRDHTVARMFYLAV